MARQLVLVMLKSEPHPTSEIIRQKCTLVLSMLNQQENSDPVDIEYLIRDIESRCEIWKGRAKVLEDNKEKHEIWLPDKKARSTGDSEEDVNVT